MLRGIESAKIRHASRREEDEAIRGYLTKHLEWRPDFYEEDSRKDQVNLGQTPTVRKQRKGQLSYIKTSDNLSA